VLRSGDIQVRKSIGIVVSHSHSVSERHPFESGLCGNIGKRAIRLRTDQREPQLDYQGCMSLNAGDTNLIRNVRFENIRVEDFREGQFLNLRVFYNRKYNTSPGRGIENVLFKDITYNGTHANPSMIAGYDDTRVVKNVVFENLQVNGRLISDDMPGKPGFYKTGDMAGIFVAEHVEGFFFRSVALAH
jgi:hypothetical protein